MNTEGGTHTDTAVHRQSLHIRSKHTGVTLRVVHARRAVMHCMCAVSVVRRGSRYARGCIWALAQDEHVHKQHSAGLCTGASCGSDSCVCVCVYVCVDISHQLPRRYGDVLQGHVVHDGE